jgi:hypothetical protein
MSKQSCIVGCGAEAPLDQTGVPIHPACADAIRLTYTTKNGIPGQRLASYQQGADYARTDIAHLDSTMADSMLYAIDQGGLAGQVARDFLYGFVTAGRVT